MKKKDIVNVVDPKKRKSKAQQEKKKTTSKKKEQEKKKTIKKEKKLEKQKKDNIKKETKQGIEKTEIKKEDKETVEEIEVEQLPLKKRIIKFIIKIGILFIGIIILITVFYALTEYKPEAKQAAVVEGEGYYTLNVEEPFTIMTWNIGYGALGDNADFFMDHGKMVQTADRNRINRNLYNIRARIDEVRPNIIFLQEVDISSTRAKHVDEYSLFKHHLNNYSTAYATNHKVLYLLYPLTNPIGNVHSGIATLSKYTIESANRIQLPSPYIWPISMVNFKRCALVSYVPIKDSDKKLVLMNVHLDAYTSDKHKEEQTKKLIKIMEQEKKKGNYVIVGGDFNQTFSNINIKKYPIGDNVWKPGKIDISMFNEEWQLLMDTETPSARSLDQPYENADKEKFQYYVIDGYIVSNNIEVQSIKTQDYEFTSTDHNPVLMKISLKKESE